MSAYLCAYCRARLWLEAVNGEAIVKCDKCKRLTSIRAEVKITDTPFIVDTGRITVPT